MPIPIAAMAIGAASPFIARIIGDALGGGVGAQLAELARARAEYERVATGGTTQAQAGMSYARARAAQELAGQAQRGTAQQRAGLQREAMRTGADVQARYAAQLADLRAREQERAREGVASVQSQIAAVRGGEAQRNRAMVSGAIMGAATPLVASMVTPTAQAGLSKEEIAQYNAMQADARPAPTDLSGFNARMEEMRQSVADRPFEVGSPSAYQGYQPVKPMIEGGTLEMPTAAQVAPAQEPSLDVQQPMEMGTAGRLPGQPMGINPLIELQRSYSRSRRF